MDFALLDPTKLTKEQLAQLKALPPERRLRWIIEVEKKQSLVAAAGKMGVTDPGLLKWVHKTPTRRGKPTWPNRFEIERYTADSVLGPIRPAEWDIATARRPALRPTGT